MKTTNNCALLILWFLTSSVLAETSDPRWSDLPHTDTEFVPRTYTTLAAWNERREHLRKQILWSAGLSPMPERTPLNARIFDRIEHDDYTVEKVSFESLPGLFVTGNLYRPRTTSPHGHPAVLNPHGHAATGRLHDDGVASYQARAITFARVGCVALIWDMIDYNDSALQLSGSYQEKTYWDVHNKPWVHVPNRRTLWNINSMGLQLWNSIRALDFLCTLPEVDAERLSSTGESGGGTQTFLLAAVDDRIKVAAPVCMVSAYMQGGCNCENAPGLRIDTHNVEFGALTAPRPMMLVSVTGDWTSHTPEVELPAIKRVYELHGAADKLNHVHFNAGHGYNLDMRNAVYPWFAKRLGLELDVKFKEQTYQTEATKDLLVFNESVPANAIRDHETLVNRVIETDRRQLEAFQPSTPENLAQNRKVFAEGLCLATGVQPFNADDVSYEPSGDFTLGGLTGERGVLIGKQRGIRIPVWRFRPTEQPAGAPRLCTLLAHGQGRAALKSKIKLIASLLAEGHTVWAIELFGIGEARPQDVALAKARGTTKNFITFNRTDHAERVYELAAAIGFCQWHGVDAKRADRVNVAAFDKAGPWLAVAAATLGPIQPNEPVVRLAVDANGFSTAREDRYLKDLLIPGILRAGGLVNAVALSAPRTMLLHNTGDAFETGWASQAYKSARPADGNASLVLNQLPETETGILRFLTKRIK